MAKTLDEFLEIEDVYNEEHKNDSFFLFDENLKAYDFSDSEDELAFLKRKKIRFYSKISETDKTRFNLDDAEIVFLRMFIGDCSKIFRIDSYIAVPQLVTEMCDILESALNKLPVFEGKELFRFCHDSDRNDFKVGDTFNPNFHLTTTKNNWNQDDIFIYIITPLSKEKTLARCVYEFRNNGEEQVTFLRYSLFIITGITPVNSEGQTFIYMDEI